MNRRTKLDDSYIGMRRKELIYRTVYSSSYIYVHNSNILNWVFTIETEWVSE